jgi:hypothetical protein
MRKLKPGTNPVPNKRNTECSYKAIRQLKRPNKLPAEKTRITEKGN